MERKTQRRQEKGRVWRRKRGRKEMEGGREREKRNKKTTTWSNVGKERVFV